jgi:hypothetical protein
MIVPGKTRMIKFIPLKPTPEFPKIGNVVEINDGVVTMRPALMWPNDRIELIEQLLPNK